MRLGGTLGIPGHAKLPVELCLVPEGVWVVAAADRFAGTLFDATSGDGVRYERGTLRDRLVVDGVALTVPPARASETMRCLALGRLRKRSRTARATQLEEDRFLSRLPEPAWALAVSLVAPGDHLIAARELGEAQEVRSELGASVKQRNYLVVSAESVRSFALSELGDHRVSELDPARLRLHAPAGRACLVTSSGDHLLDSSQASLVAELLELTELGPEERLFEAARRLHLVPAGNGLARSRRLVEAAAGRGHRLSRLVSLLLALRENPHERFADSTLLRVADAAREASESTLAELVGRWDFAPEPVLGAARELRALGARAEPLALNLRRVHRDRAPDDAALDADLAEHELACGDPERARRVAEQRLSRLPPDEDAAFSPSQRSPSHSLRVRLHDLVARASERTARGAAASLAALARLEPLRESRLTALAGATPEGALDDRLTQRARDVLECLGADGLSRPPLPAERELPRPLDPIVLNERVAHPLSRGSGRLAARLSELVAAVPEPELGFLRDFCEELGESRHPDARRALGRATHLLGLGAVRAYVSHGARSLGLRAFGNHEPFVLVGASHLTEGSPHALAGAELDFAFGAELAHLAFGHQRVTVSEVWIGAAGKTRDALMALGMVLPMIAEIGGGRAFQLLKRVSPETVARGAEAADRLEKLVVGRKSSLGRALGQHNEELIAAHRLVQLSADRAGLVLSQHLPSALRTILLTRADYRDLLLLASEQGLLAALERRPLPEAAMADLVVRVRALIAFYLSTDFDAIVGNTAFTTPPSRSSFSLLP